MTIGCASIQTSPYPLIFDSFNEAWIQCNYGKQQLFNPQKEPFILALFEGNAQYKTLIVLS